MAAFGSNKMMLSRILSPVFLASLTISNPGLAQNIDLQRQTLQMITSTADSICNIVTSSGSSSSTEVQGNVRAQLEGLARRLGEAGINGSGRITSDQYQGVIREQLATTLDNNAKCKLEVFQSLRSLVISTSTASPRIFSVTRESGWRGGGYSPDLWCEALIGTLRGEHPQGQFQVTSKSERSESKCAPFNCPQYNYTCSVQVTVTGG